MNFKKILALLLALVFVVFAFAGCAPKGEVEEETTEPVKVNLDPSDLASYVVVRSITANSEVTSAATKLANALAELTGVKNGVRNDEAELPEGTCEILVGETNRVESEEAIELLDDLTYSISNSDNRIMIVASNDMLIGDAVDFFINNMAKLDDGSYEFVVEHTGGDYKEVNLVTKGKANYAIVYTSFFNNLNQHTDKCAETVGFTENRARELASKLEEITDAKFTCGAEDDKSLKDSKKIIVGMPKGNVDTYFDYYENGVHIKDGNIYIYGHTMDGIDKAISNFLSRLEKYRKLVNNKKHVLLCNKDGYKWEDSTIKYDIPLPEKLKYEGTYLADNDGAYFVYEKVSKSDFDAYTKLLKSNGFEKYYDRHQAEKGYNQRNYFEGYKKGEDAVWAYYINDRKEMRIVFETYQPLPEFSAEGGSKPASVMQMGTSFVKGDVNEGSGMGYIVTLEDGSYIVIDGNTGANRQRLAQRYYDYMVENSADGKVVIAAWIITHGHSDHYEVFETFGGMFGDKVECKYIIHNLPDASILYGAGNVGTYYLQNSKSIDAKFKGATVFTVHTGYATTIGGVFVEFMCTYEDLYNNHDVETYAVDAKDPKMPGRTRSVMPHSVDEFNDTNTTVRLVFNKGKADEAKVFFLGDCYFAQGERLASMWDADYMKSDVVQMAHHGYNNGVTSGQAYSKDGRTEPNISTTYSEIRAKYGFVPAPESRAIDSSQPIKIMEEANPEIVNPDNERDIVSSENGKTYHTKGYNLYTSEYDGKATNVTLTFDGGIKFTKTTASND